MSGEIVLDATMLGVHTTAMDDEASWRAAQVRAETGLSLPDACVLDAALHQQVSLATFDVRLAAVAVASGVPLFAL